MEEEMPPVIIVPPSTLLPPVRKALALPCPEVARLVGELARIYTPDVLGTQFEVVTPARQGTYRKKRVEKSNIALNLPAVDSGYASLVASDDESDNGECSRPVYFADTASSFLLCSTFPRQF
jgi:hypothetical protein